MDELLKQIELLQESNDNLTKVVGALNERINLTNKRCDLLFEYCNKLKKGDKNYESMAIKENI